MIAVTFALPAESSEFLSRLKDKSRADRNGIRVIRGKIDDRDIEILHTGVGEKVCRQRVEKFLQDHQFDLLITTGFAGALNDELQPGDLLLAKNFSTIDLNEDCQRLRDPRNSADGTARDHRHAYPTIPCAAGDFVRCPATANSDRRTRHVFPGPSDAHPGSDSVCEENCACAKDFGERARQHCAISGWGH